jgi:hypothetical protein
MEKSLEREAAWDCTQLIQRFYWCLDDQRYDDLANLFTETGAWVRLGKELVGPKTIRETMIKERKNWITAHLLSNLQVTVKSETAASSTQYVTLYRHEDWDASKGPAPVVLPLGILRHRDELVRVGGEWKFQRKTSKAVMVDRVRVTHYDQR